MAKSEADTCIVTTSAKVFLNDWVALRDIINEHVTLIKEAANADAALANPATALFSDQQMDDALNGPYQAFIKQKLSAYAKIARVRLKLTVDQDENLRAEKHPEQDNPALDALIENISTNDLDNMQSELDELTKAHHAMWQSQLSEWKNHLAHDIQQKNVLLSDLEMKELEDQEPASELLNRLIDLKIELPKKINRANNYKHYYTLKTKLAVFNALSRQHKPHTNADIEAITKTLKPSFNDIENAETALVNAQRLETEAIIAPLIKVNELLNKPAE